MSKYSSIKSIAQLEVARKALKKEIVAKQVDIYLDVQDLKSGLSPAHLLLTGVTSVAPNLILRNVAWPVRKLLLAAVRKVKSKLIK